jgi:hypothetical protein
MTIAQAQAAIAVVVGLVLSLGGLLLVTALVFTDCTQRASETLTLRPKRAFWLGIVSTVIAVVGFGLVQMPVGAMKLVGAAVLGAMSIVLCIGGAGLAHLLGDRMAEMSGSRTEFGNLVRGALLIAVAAFFPLVGWWVFAPLAALFSMGAGFSAILPSRSAESGAFQANQQV